MELETQGTRRIESERRTAGRRWILAALAFAVIFFPAFLLIWSWPNVYRSTATVFVEPQQIPEDLVKSTVTSSLETRLQRIREEILSRARLEGFIDQFGLYRDLKASQPIEAVIDRMRKDISFELRRSEASGAVAFSVSYQGADSDRVANVANTLASMYIEENLKIREEQASSTSRFFKIHLEQARQELQKMEQRMADLKRARGGQVPDHEEQQLMRDQEIRTEFYRSLLRHQMEAELAETMEQRQKGEQFRIVDPAFVSEVPASPNRPLFWAIAFVVAIGVAGAVSIWPRRRLASPHSAGELPDLQTSIQISVPKTVTLRDGSGGTTLLLLQAVATILSLMILLGALYWLVLVNERLPTLMR